MDGAGQSLGLSDAPHPMPRPWLSSAAKIVRREIEAEQERWFLWLAVAFGAGIAVYFASYREPPFWTLALATAGALLGHAFLHRVGLWRLGSGFLLAMAAGGLIAKLRTEAVRAPVLAEPVNAVLVRGWVELVEPRSTQGQRVTIRVRSMERLPPQGWPQRVRVRSMREDKTLTPGSAVRVRANLAGPQAPTIPGDFDFGRHAWFNALGAIGLAAGPIVVEETDATPPLSLRIKAAIEAVRYRITRRIMAGLPGETGAIAAALITGERGGISEATNAAYRDSGLFHILSISGLHMVVMAGAIFVLIRSTLALIAPVALNFPIKKWAAGGALVGALGYLLISGASFATVRSYLMISIMFLAVMLDRNAVALRNVALSAMLILFLFPESVFDPGFQMSYAAVTGLVSIYEAIRTRAESEAAGRPAPGVVGTGASHFSGIIISTIIASAVVAPFGIYHFHNTQLMAMLANLVALPLCDIYVMPLALAVLIAMPFGLEQWPLWAMGLGIDGMTAVARWVGALPVSVVRIPAIPTLSFVLMIVGGLWVLLWSRRWRLLGFAPIILGLLLTPNRLKPDMIVSRDAATVAVRGADGRLSAVAMRSGLFELARWLEYDGDTRAPKDVATAQAFRCDALGCASRIGGREIAIVASAAALRDHCGSAAVIVARFLAAGLCDSRADGRTRRPIIIDPERSRAGNGHVITLNGDGTVVETVEEARGDRPWSRTGVLASAQRARQAAGPASGGRETNVPFATTPPDPHPDPDDDAKPGRGGFP